jgi:hypothetical protein
VLAFWYLTNWYVRHLKLKIFFELNNAFPVFIVSNTDILSSVREYKHWCCIYLLEVMNTPRLHATDDHFKVWHKTSKWMWDEEQQCTITINMFVGFYVSYTQTSNKITYRVMFGVRFTDERISVLETINTGNALFNSKNIFNFSYLKYRVISLKSIKFLLYFSVPLVKRVFQMTRRKHLIQKIKQRRIFFVLGYLRMILWKNSTAISIKHRILATFNIKKNQFL